MGFRVIKLRMSAFASYVNDAILFKNSYDFSKFQCFRPQYDLPDLRGRHNGFRQVIVPYSDMK